MVLPGCQGEAQALTLDAAPAAYRFGQVHLPGRRARRGNREEQVRILVTAGAEGAPVFRGGRQDRLSARDHA
jgi:hypothetical protein